MIRVAILIPGGLEHPEAGLAIPAMTEWLKRLSRRCRLEVFSLRGRRSPREPVAVGEATVTYLDACADHGLPRKLGSYWRTFRNSHRQRPFDLVHGLWALPAGLAATLLGKRFGLPSLVSLQGADTARLPELDFGALRSRRNRVLARWACAHAGVTTALSRFQAGLVSGWRCRDLRVLPYGANPEFFHRETRDLQPPYRFLAVGHQNPVKDHGTLLRAFQRIADRVPAALRVIGGDFMAGANQRLARELGVADRVQFLGALPHHELPAHFGWADCLLHASRYEAQAVAVAEAAASGLLIVGVRAGLLADLDGTGARATPPGDDRAMAEAALALLADASARQRARSAAQAWARGHDIEWTAQSFAELYEELV